MKVRNDFFSNWNCKSWKGHVSPSPKEATLSNSPKTWLLSLTLSNAFHNVRLLRTLPHWMRRLLSELSFLLAAVIMQELRTTFLFTDTRGEPTEEERFKGLRWGKGLTHTHSPKGRCVCVCRDCNAAHKLKIHVSMWFVRSAWRWLTPREVNFSATGGHLGNPHIDNLFCHKARCIHLSRHSIKSP